MTPQVSAFPPAPSRANTPDQFNERADAFVAQFAVFVPQVNTLADFVVGRASAASSDAANTLTNRNQAQVFRDQSAASALSAQQSAASAQGFALQAGMATDVPVLIFQPQRLTQSLAIPNGQNAHTIGPFEVDPSVTIEGVGSATWTGL